MMYHAVFHAKAQREIRRKKMVYFLTVFVFAYEVLWMEKENELAKIIVDRCYGIHRMYGPGLLERVYERILDYELRKIELKTEVQKCIPLKHEQLKIPIAFRADIIVEGSVLIEVKSVEELPKLYYKQVLTYLRLTDLKLGILVNFNVELIKNGLHRIVNNL